jgi:DNA-binding IclR family transcriptional regulator
MNILTDIFFFQRIDNLIRSHATGTPKVLAKKLGISECSTYRLLESLKSQGFPITYDKEKKTYYYEKNVD